MQNILIAYASKYGSTTEIAAVIQQELVDQGLNVTLLPVEMLDAASLDGYDVVILGSAIYMGQWLESARRFVTTHEEALRRIPLWVFSSGPTNDGLIAAPKIPPAVTALVAPLAPRDVTVFRGKLNPRVLSLAERLILKIMNSPQGDFRDWDAVRAWSADIATALLPLAV
jgi:menaquinone-dependent protoporphyrinogen oxidase